MQASSAPLRLANPTRLFMKIPLFKAFLVLKPCFISEVDGRPGLRTVLGGQLSKCRRSAGGCPSSPRDRSYRYFCTYRNLASLPFIILIFFDLLA